MRGAAVTARPGPDITVGGSTLNLKLPTLGSDQYFLTYHLRDQLRFPYMAAPIAFLENSTTATAIQIQRGRPSAFYRTFDGGLLPVDSFTPGRGHYKQVTRPSDDSTVSSPTPLERSLDPAMSEPAPVPIIPSWTTAISPPDDFAPDSTAGPSTGSSGGRNCESRLLFATSISTRCFTSLSSI